MRRAVNIVGAAIGVHALAFSALGMLELPPPFAPRVFVVEPVLVPELSDPRDNTHPPPPPPGVRQPEPRARPLTSAAKLSDRRDKAHPPPQPPGVGRAPPRAATSPIASRASSEPAPPRPVEPTRPAPGSDAAVLLGAIAKASKNDAGIDGGLGNADGESPGAARGTAFLRGGARGVTTPAHESKAEPARPVEDYTRLVPRYSDEAIEHDLSTSVAMRLEVDQEGRVIDARILKSAGYGLDEIALETVKDYRFTPAKDDEGRPVRTIFGWRIVWESHWKRLVTTTISGRPNCRGQGPLNLGEIHPVYIDCDGEAGYFELAPEQR
jgi:TonB family protein